MVGGGIGTMKMKPRLIGMTDQEKTNRFLDAIKPLAPGSDLTVPHGHEPETDAQPNECYSNCQKKVGKSGGTMQCGWIFAARREHDYVIASPHAVWRSPEGVLIDITPRLPSDNLPKSVVPPLRDTEGHVFFLPDAKAFERPSKFLPLTKNKALIRACRLRNRHEWQLWHDPEAMAKRVEELRQLRDSHRTEARCDPSQRRGNE
jgi:hypothetical protein